MKNINKICASLVKATTLLVGFSSVAHAAGPLALCEPGVPFKWANNGQNIPFNPDQGGLGPLSPAEAIALTEQAFQAWGDVPTSSASYINAGTLPVDIDISNFGIYIQAPTPDGLSAIAFDENGEIFDLLFGPGSGILGFAGPEWIDSATCEITEGFAFLNGPAFTNLTAALDVMVHEFGHYSNLAHSIGNGQIVGFNDEAGPTPFTPVYQQSPIDLFNSNTTETMYPFYFGPGTGFASLEADDVASLSQLYPAPSFAARGNLSGTVFSTDGVSAVGGVNVIARNEADPYKDVVSAVSGDFTQDPSDGSFTLNNLTPGADYRIYIDEILAGGFPQTPALPFPGEEEYFNGAGESNNLDTPDPAEDFTLVQPGASDVDFIINSPRPGDALEVFDDGFVQFTLPFEYEICGESFKSLFIHANGFVTFGGPDTLFNFEESVVGLLLTQPRIAPLWTDLSPFNLATGEPQGLVTFEQSKNTFTLIFENVPAFPNEGANSFTMTLKRANNSVEISYGNISAETALVGISCGAAITSGREVATDISAKRGTINLHNQPAYFEQFTVGNEFDLNGRTIKMTGTTTYNDNWAENNNTQDQARSIKLPFSSDSIQKYTEIEPTGADIDWYKFDVEAGKTILAEIAEGQLDTFIALVAPDGSVVTDDDNGKFLLSRIAVTASETGTYYLAVTTFPDFGLEGAGQTGGRYILEVDLFDGVILALGDDTSSEVELGFAFPFNGTSYSSVFVNSNGNLTFGAGSTSFAPSVQELLDAEPRIAPLWDDLSPNQSGRVSVTYVEGSSATITFDSIPEFASFETNTFAVTLRADGSYTIAYGVISSVDSTVGVSPGNGAADPGAIDLSTSGLLPASGVSYEQFVTDLSGVTLEFQP